MMPPEVAILIATLCDKPFTCTMIVEEPGFWAFSRHFQGKHFESCIVLSVRKWTCVNTDPPPPRRRER